MVAVQDDLLHDLLRVQAQADKPVITQILIPAFLVNCSHIQQFPNRPSQPGQLIKLFKVVR